ncbi:hypothetical protein Clacol_008846 [Clathrus columnatus]|uniref:SUZ domain-containing protein n=1 Tax=Clathrus columnatus TaxID=1419009 RepID=A0AAV5AJL8_9AGAM|nr:hypothetical protein Clacol_008846 [Clathrus columnatus]
MSPSDDHTWEKDISSTIKFAQRSKPNKTSVRDSWDDDEDEDEDEKLSEPEIIWERENSRAPMPHVQLSTTMATSGISLPPPAVFKEPLRILKRSDNTSKSSPISPNPHTTKSLEEREAQYLAARKRIFGDKGMEVVAFPSSPFIEAPRSVVIRDPIGPQSGNQTSNFQRRQKTGNS